MPSIFMFQQQLLGFLLVLTMTTSNHWSPLVLLPAAAAAAADLLGHCQSPEEATMAYVDQNSHAAAQGAPALYVLGDSTLDSGNNNLLPVLVKGKYLPYGWNFMNRCPTGRYTNGELVADFIAELLGLPYPPPYLALQNITGLKWLTGFNYASGGCGILNESGAAFGKCLNLEDQINLLTQTINYKLKPAFPDPDQLSRYLAKSIFLIWIGHNDYLLNYMNHITGEPNYDSEEEFTDNLIHEYSRKLNKLYSLGARNIVVFELMPLGCLPGIRDLKQPSERCDPEYNSLATAFNAKLAPMIDRLALSLPGSEFVLGDRIYDHILDNMFNPSKYGLTNSDGTCCTVLAPNVVCVPELPPCENPHQYFFWDADHPTEAAYKNIAHRCFNGSDICSKNIKQLVQ